MSCVHTFQTHPFPNGGGEGEKARALPFEFPVLGVALALMAERNQPSTSLNSNERKELLVGEVPTGEQLFYLSFDEFREG